MAIKECVHRLKVLADETRLMILRDIMDSSKSVTEINGKLRIEQSLLSHHLRVLRDAKLVVSERLGKSVMYRASPDILEGPRDTSIDLGCCQVRFDQVPSKGQRK